MPHFKKQHWLPAAYLRNFSVDGPASSRKSMIWRVDARARRKVPVESQGFADYHYSKADAEQVEREFKAGEDFYAECYPDFWNRDSPGSARRSFGLLLLMLDLHIRNVAYAKSARNNHVDYLSMSATVKCRILWGRREALPDDQAIVDEATKHWRVAFVRCQAGHIFLTSDNPSLLVRVGSRRAFVNVVLMPVTPLIYAVGYDSRLVEVRPGVMSESDEGTLTRLQVRNCLSCVYAREDITDEQWTGFKLLLAKRAPRRPVEGPGKWGADIFELPGQGGLGFLRLRPRPQQPARA